MVNVLIYKVEKRKTMLSLLASVILMSSLIFLCQGMAKLDVFDWDLL